MSKFDEILNSSDASDALLGEQIDKLNKNIDDIKDNTNESRIIINQLSGFSNECNFKITATDQSINERRSCVELVMCNQAGKPPVKIEFTVVAPNGHVRENIKVDNPNGSAFDVDVYTRYNESEKSTNVSVYFKSISNLWGDTYLCVPGRLNKVIKVENSSSIRTDTTAVKTTQSKVAYV